MAETQRTRPGEQGGAPTADPDSNKALVAPLATFGRHDLAIAGGKGANLGELVRAGFPVPPGFVVTTAAYERFVAAGGVAGAMQQALAGLDVSDSVALERASEAIQQAFATAPVPPELAGTIAAAYRSLGQASQPAPSSDGGAPHAAAASPVPAATAPPAVAAPAVAVRSSATAEDLPSASFAGQQETYLNVAGEDALLDAVRRCWASLWSPRAIAYRHRQGIDHRTVKLAVVVQHLVDAEAAGVLFTVNPITGARDELVIDANPGLGEAVVSGIVTPDHYVLKKGTYAVVEQQLGRREVIIRPAA